MVILTEQDHDVARVGLEGEKMKIVVAAFLLGVSASMSLAQNWVSMCVSNSVVVVKTERQTRYLVVGPRGDIFSDIAYDCAGDVCSSPGLNVTTRFMQFYPSGSGKVGDYRSVTLTSTLNGEQVSNRYELRRTVSTVRY